jgi:hypothetical protein
MKIDSFKLNTKRMMAIAAIAVLSSAWAGTVVAKDLVGGIQTGGWGPYTATRQQVRDLTWQQGWNKCRAANIKTRSIYIDSWYVEFKDRANNRTAWTVYWNCSDSTKAPADGGPWRQ